MQKAYMVEAWAREWFQCGVGRWNPRTEGGYRNLIERHIVPGVGKVKLEALKPVHINRLYAELAEKGLSAKSVWCIHLLLWRILDAACKDGLLNVNPANFCKAPDAEKKPPFRLRQSQIRRYLDTAESAGVLPVIYIGLTVGLRQCEQFTLPWADFNLECRYILRGKRLLTLSDRAVALLEAEHTRHPDSPYAFLNPKTGAPYRLHEFYYLHRKLSAQARLPKQGFRDLQTQCMEEKL